MGSELVGEPWLLTLAERGPSEARVVTKLLRMQVLTYKRFGHDVRLETEYLRRVICAAARWGKLASTYVACSNCGAQATLADWVASALMTEDERIQFMGNRIVPHGKTLDGFLFPCPGKQYAADIARSDRLPREGG